MGFSLRKLGDYKQAATFYQKALEFDPEHRSALEYQGELLHRDRTARRRSRTSRCCSKLCPKGCEELEDLEEAIAAAKKAARARLEARCGNDGAVTAASRA